MMSDEAWRSEVEGMAHRREKAKLEADWKSAWKEIDSRWNYRDARLMVEILRALEKGQMIDEKTPRAEVEAMAERERVKGLVEALERIANLPGPTFNGERVWTVSEFNQQRRVAEAALKAYREWRV